MSDDNSQRRRIVTARNLLRVRRVRPVSVDIADRYLRADPSQPPMPLEGSQKGADAAKTIIHLEGTLERRNVQALLRLELRSWVISIAPPRPAPLEVPGVSERVLSLVCPPYMVDAVMGDLEERFGKLATRHGPGFARWWYRYQVGWATLSFGGRLFTRLGSIAEIFKRLT